MEEARLREGGRCQYADEQNGVIFNRLRTRFFFLFVDSSIHSAGH